VLINNNGIKLRLDVNKQKNFRRKIIKDVLIALPSKTNKPVLLSEAGLLASGTGIVTINHSLSSPYPVSKS
jgi:hypothetical protein